MATSYLVRTAGPRPGHGPLLRIAATAALGLGVLLAFSAFGCSSDETSVGGGGTGGVGGTTSTSGTGGTGGPALECETPGDCAGETTDCSWPTCTAGSCGLENAGEGESCDEHGGDVCDGEGQCVKSDGQACGTAGECLSGICVDDVCCDLPCDGACQACDTPTLVGQCTPHLAGTDPELDCTAPTAGVCDGAGSCAIGNHLWSHGFGDGSAEWGWGVAVDSADNVVIVGYFTGTITFGTSTLTSLGGDDIFVAKFDSSGNHLWSDRFGDLEHQRGLDVAVDSADNIIITGYFGGAFSFGSTPILYSNGGFDVFVTKLDPNGNAQWSQGFGDGAEDFGQQIAVDGSDNVVLAGHFNADIDFDGAPPALTSVGGQDIYVAKLDPTGNHLWSAQYGDVGLQAIWDLAVDGSDNVLLAGYFQTGIDFGNGSLANGGGQDIFVAKIDSTGTHQFSHSFGGADNQWAVGITADSADNVIFTGGFRGTVDFGGTPFTSTGGWDIFVTKLDGSGAHLDSLAFGNAADWQVGWAVATDSADNIVFVADLAGSADFGGGPLTSAGVSDTVVVKLSQDFSHLWSNVYGAVNDQFVIDVAIDSARGILLTGVYRVGIDFGGGALPNQGGQDVFLAKLAP